MEVGGVVEICMKDSQARSQNEQELRRSPSYDKLKLAILAERYQLGSYLKFRQMPFKMK